MACEQAPAAKDRNGRLGAIAIGIILAVIGLWLSGGGALLLTLGGSPYYVIAGVGCLMAAYFYLTRPETRGMAVYLLVFLATCIWAFAEVGADYWQLLPRIGGPAAMAVLVSIHRLFADTGARRIAWSTLGVAIAAFAALLLDLRSLPRNHGRHARRKGSHHRR